MQHIPNFSHPARRQQHTFSSAAVPNARRCVSPSSIMLSITVPMAIRPCHDLKDARWGEVHTSVDTCKQSERANIYARIKGAVCGFDIEKLT